VLIHSYEPITLPTWHHLSTVPAENNVSHVTEPANVYAGRVHFLINCQANRGALPVCHADLQPVANLYLVDNQAYDPANHTFPMNTFTEFDHVTPDVLWFVWLFDTLSSNNSQYMQGTVPIANIRPYIPTQNALRVCA